MINLFRRKGLSELTLEHNRLKERQAIIDRHESEKRKRADEEAKLRSEIFEMKHGSTIRKITRFANGVQGTTKKIKRVVRVNPNFFN